ncbi:MAG: hypothetical protein QF797_07530 [Alphaproteobacteria bacterium]|nr:hypothetical protein [Alphaproteobacteria bacterium]MDP6623935.1 hypothetical protein [Alphaproteobacteria bacterium]
MPPPVGLAEAATWLAGIELLTKPFGKKDLAARVRAVLDRS